MTVAAVQETAGGGVRAGQTRHPELPMVKAEIVEAVLQALARGTPLVGVARQFGLDPKTVRGWRTRGAYRPREPRRVTSRLDPHATWLAVRAPEVGFNAAVLHRELREQGFVGSEVIVRRAVRPLRIAALPAAATVRFESAPGEQAQVDFGQVRCWIGEARLAAQVFVCTLGYSRRVFAVAFARQRLTEFLAGHEQAFRHCGGVPDRVVVDNAKALVLAHTRASTGWHPTYADFAAHYGFRPWACWPYRPQTKGKVESGVKYVQRNALAGKRFGSWEHLNTWLLEWATTVADQRVHGTTHETPAVRFAAEALTPLGARPPYQREHVRHRVVASDALVSIAGSRYSVPARYVGATVTVHERTDGFEIRHADAVIAAHAEQPRRQVVMVPEHYAGLLRADRTPRLALPPQYDPRYPAAGIVAVRDLAVYEAAAAAVACEVAA